MVATEASHEENKDALENNAALMDKYSRQIGAYGLEAMSKLLNLKVLVVGLQGVGIETAKDLVLAGPGAVTLYDPTPATIADLGANFFLREDDVGKPRAEAVASRLQELNGMVAVSVAPGTSLTCPPEETIKSHSCVVFCNGAQKDLLACDAVCREAGVAFIAVGTLGGFGYVFSDFGQAHVIKDATGENVATRLIVDVTNDKEGAVVSLLGANGEEGGRLHGIECTEHEGWVEISDVEGMDGAINTPKGRPVKVKTMTKTVTHKVKNSSGEEETKEKQAFDGYRLRLEGVDSSALSPYKNGGVLTQVKQPFTKAYRSLQDSLLQPVAEGEFGLLFTDGAKFGRGEQLHFALLALWAFEEAKGRLPEAGNKAESAEVLSIAEGMVKKHKAEAEGSCLVVEELEAKVVEKLALYAAVELQPLAAFFGGVVAQEVVKLTGKYSPLNQWLHMDFVEVLPDEPADDAGPQGTRYDHLLSVYGQRFVQDKLNNGKTFMVGCGALGCEFLKNFALLGVGVGPEGGITVTDNDRIEVSNLSRQFLFREENVGQPKSQAAADAVIAMNKAIKLTTMETLVCPETESSFPDAFWESQDWITNALDNVKARLYVDSRCVFYAKPLLESGTLGTKCNVQVVIPHVTASYSDGPKDDNNQDSIPMCTLRNFPSLIEHCIEWARAQFEDTFVAPFAEAKKFVNNRDAFLSAIRSTTLDNPNKAKALSASLKAAADLQVLKDIVDKGRKGLTFSDCLTEAFGIFHAVFRDKVLQLIHSFPEDHRVESGERFWTGAKRFPTAAHLDFSNPQHMAFVISAANILAAGYGVLPPPEEALLPLDAPERQVEAAVAHLTTLDVPMWTPSGEKVDLSEGGETTTEAADDAMDVTDGDGDDGSLDKVAALLQELQEVDLKGLRFSPADFEKDQDLNFHIDFVSAAANLRAHNYRIKETSRHSCKMIAGKIIPALATTTASVCGLVMVELLKVLQGKPLEAYKDSSNNLGLNSYFFSEPAPPEKAKDEYDPINMAEVRCVPSAFTKWDKTVVDCGDLTLRQFLDAFKQQTGLTVELLFHSVSELEGAQRGLMLFDLEAWSPKLKELYASKMDCSLRKWTAERYQEAPVEVMLPTRKYVELQVTALDDEGNPCRVPACVYRWAR